MKYTQYYKEIIRLGLPILVGQAGTVAVGFADNIMVGRYSTDALASASFVGNVFNTIIFCIIGFSYGILPLAGALFAKSRKIEIGELMRSATVINTIYTLVITALMTWLYFNLHRLGQPEYLLPTIRSYYLLYLAGLVPVSLFNVFAQWSYAVRNTQMPMWIILIANAINILGNYVLIYGHCGAPELGLFGAGLSTLFARVLSMAAIIGIFIFKKSNAEYAEGFIHPLTTSGQRWKIFKISLPVSMQMTFESASFSLAAIMAGWIGAIALASFQIVVIVGMLGFTLYYAIGSAVAVTVANECGHADKRAMRRAAWAGYHIMLCMAACTTLILSLFGRHLIWLFTEDTQVLAVAVTLILPLILYQLGDATQITFANALRGTSNVSPMLWVAFVSYLIVGVPCTYMLAFPLGMGIYGIVLSFSVSLFLAGGLFLTFFLRTTKS